MAASLPARLLITLCIIATTVRTFASLDKERQSKGSAPSKGRKSFSWDFSIVGHRGGASGFIPEHSSMSYTIGAQHGADYIEPDVVFTSDGIQILQHDVDLAATTNVEQVFGKDSEQYTPDDTIEFFWRTVDEGGPSTHPYRETRGGYFSWNFSFADIQTLSLRSDDLTPSPFDDLNLPVMTMETFLQLLIGELSPVLGRPLGVIPEIKYHHEYSQRLGQDVELIHLETLAKYGYLHKEIDTNNNDEPFYYAKTLCELATDIGLADCDEQLYGEKPAVILQSFNSASLQIFRRYTDAPLVYLAYYDYDITNQEFVDWTSSFADGLGVNSPGLEELKAVEMPDEFVIFEYTHGFSVDAYFESMETGIVDAIFTDDSNTARCVQETLDYIAENKIKVKHNRLKRNGKHQ